MIMEVVGGAASVSQLVVYISSSARTLHRLYTELHNGDSAYCDEESNIGLLLNILQRLARQDIGDHHPVLPVLIAISGVACEVLNLLQPRKVLGINWAPLTAQTKLKAAFESLDKKRLLLHLYVSQAHHDALVDLREAIDRSSMTVSLHRTAHAQDEPLETEDQVQRSDTINSATTHDGCADTATVPPSNTTNQEPRESIFGAAPIQHGPSGPGPDDATIPPPSASSTEHETSHRRQRKRMYTFHRTTYKTTTRTRTYIKTYRSKGHDA
jgi:hypothetical protein